MDGGIFPMSRAGRQPGVGNVREVPRRDYDELKKRYDDLAREHNWAKATIDDLRLRVEEPRLRQVHNSNLAEIKREEDLLSSSRAMIEDRVFAQDRERQLLKRLAELEGRLPSPSERAAAARREKELQARVAQLDAEVLQLRDIVAAQSPAPMPSRPRRTEIVDPGNDTAIVMPSRLDFLTDPRGSRADGLDKPALSHPGLSEADAPACTRRTSRGAARPDPMYSGDFRTDPPVSGADDYYRADQPEAGAAFLTPHTDRGTRHPEPMYHDPATAVRAADTGHGTAKVQARVPHTEPPLHTRNTAPDTFAGVQTSLHCERYTNPSLGQEVVQARGGFFALKQELFGLIREYNAIVTSARDHDQIVRGLAKQVNEGEIRPAASPNSKWRLEQSRVQLDRETIVRGRRAKMVDEKRKRIEELRATFRARFEELRDMELKAGCPTTSADVCKLPDIAADTSLESERLSVPESQVQSFSSVFPAVPTAVRRDSEAMAHSRRGPRYLGNMVPQSELELHHRGLPRYCGEPVPFPNQSAISTGARGFNSHYAVTDTVHEWPPVAPTGVMTHAARRSLSLEKSAAEVFTMRPSAADYSPTAVTHGPRAEQQLYPGKSVQLEQGARRQVRFDEVPAPTGTRHETRTSSDGDLQLADLKTHSPMRTP